MLRTNPPSFGRSSSLVVGESSSCELTSAFQVSAEVRSPFQSVARYSKPVIISEQESMDKRAPITVKFEIPYFTVSGIQVRYLKIVEKSGYQALPWVRYITQNGDDYRSVPIFLKRVDDTDFRT